MVKDRKQLSEVMIGIVSGYFASRGVGGGRRVKSDVNAINRRCLLILVVIVVKIMTASAVTVSVT